MPLDVKSYFKPHTFFWFSCVDSTRKWSASTVKCTVWGYLSTLALLPKDLAPVTASDTHMMPHHMYWSALSELCCSNKTTLNLSYFWQQSNFVTLTTLQIEGGPAVALPPALPAHITSLTDHWLEKGTGKSWYWWGWKEPPQPPVWRAATGWTGSLSPLPLPHPVTAASHSWPDWG